MKVETGRPVECMFCFKKVPEVFQVTAEDIQREKPPRLDLRVCSSCLQKIRSDARLENNYRSGRAVLEFSLLVPAIFGALAVALVGALAILGWSGSQVWRASFFIGGAAALTGVKMVYSSAGSRYASTHDLMWSFTSRDVIVWVSVVVSGVLLVALAPAII